jgi:hypothetical protein
MKDKRTSILFIALLLTGCATLTTQIVTGADVVAQSPRPTYASSFHKAESESPVQSATGTEYFVAPDGNNDNPGTEALPWRTIQKAANTLAAGDTVYIKNGTYHEQVVPVDSGTPGNYITYSAYPGHSPVIDGTGVFGDYRGLFEVNASYIVVSGLTVRNSTAAAIHVRKSNNIIIRENRTEESVSSGIGVWRSSDIVVDGNVIVNAKNSPSGQEEHISIASVEDFEVKNNQVYSVDNGSYSGAGIDVKESSSYGKVYKNIIHDLPSSGIYVDAWDGYNHHHEIFQNYIYNTSVGISIGSERDGEVRYLNIYNNIIYHVSFAGIRFQQAGEDGLRRDVHIFNNTIVESYSHGGAGILVETYSVQNIVLINNLINFGPDTTCGQIKAYVPDEIVSITNLVYGPKKQTQDPNLVEITDGTIEAAPKFVDRETQDFHLQRDSPAVDGGSDVDLNFDFDGVLRPQGEGYDIGAYERLAGLVLTGIPADQTIHLNWTHDGITLPVTSTWKIDYQSTTGTVYVPINIVTSTVHAYALTDLSNYVWYTVTLNAMLDTTPFLTDTVRVMPTDKSVYLPMVRNQ